MSKLPVIHIRTACTETHELGDLDGLAGRRRVTNRAAKRARRREARRARKDAAQAEHEAHVTLFHGTAYAHDASVRRHGLRPPGDRRRGPFLTSDPERAMAYGVRAAVWHGEQTGKRDDRLIVHTVRVPRDALRVDETEEDGTAWWVPGGVPPEWVIGWEAFDGGPAVDDREAIVQGMRLMIAAERFKAGIAVPTPTLAARLEPSGNDSSTTSAS